MRDAPIRCCPSSLYTRTHLLLYWPQHNTTQHNTKGVNMDGMNRLVIFNLSQLTVESILSLSSSHHPLLWLLFCSCYPLLLLILSLPVNITTSVCCAIIHTLRVTVFIVTSCCGRERGMAGRDGSITYCVLRCLFSFLYFLS